jgi:5-methylcytosine-specific restriction enzyme subunit McrC
MAEWQRRGPADTPVLAGLTLSTTPMVQNSLAALNQSGRLEILQLAGGLEIRTRSFVGQIQLGPLRLTIRPKLTGLPLLHLLRFAYGLRQLHLLDDSLADPAASPFQDLLITQLLAEVTELLTRGLHRSYQPQVDWLTSPRGRIDFQRLATQGGVQSAALPCRHQPRLADHHLNQMLLAGLRFSLSLADEATLRADLRHLVRQMEIEVTTVKLTHARLRRAGRELSRMTAAYQPSLTLIGLLYEAAGLHLDDVAPAGLALPGFLFDMNRFFQALLLRFLQDYLPQAQVQSEVSLTGMFGYLPGYNPQHRPAPLPRPDFVIKKPDQPPLLLDAKYRDLWNESLPRVMLYQLALYALNQPQQRQAVILYPAMDSLARESRLALHDPVTGRPQATVCLRPVNLHTLSKLVSQPDSGSVTLAKQQFAGQMLGVTPVK